MTWLDFDSEYVSTHSNMDWNGLRLEMDSGVLLGHYAEEKYAVSECST
jgi:hypothetical protein